MDISERICYTGQYTMHENVAVKSVFYVYVYGRDRREGEGGGGRADILI